MIQNPFSKPKPSEIQARRRPTRMSETPVEDRKPSVLIEVLVWVAFIVPIIFLWLAFESWIMVGIIVAIRILIMGVSHYDRVKKANSPKKPKGDMRNYNLQVESKQQIAAPVTGDSKSSIAYPFIEEASSEFNWLMKKLHLKDDKEEERLKIYRKLRGWE